MPSSLDDLDDLFGMPEAGDLTYPDWYTPSKDRKRANLRVLRGRHPLGFDLGPAGSTCGTCRHMYRKHRAKTYLKCSQIRATGGPATDVRTGWRGCEKWEGDDAE